MIGKEILLVEDKPEMVIVFREFLRKCKIDEKLIHTLSFEEAIVSLSVDEISDLKVIVIRFSSLKQADLISRIRELSISKYVPMVILASSWGKKEEDQMKHTVINALIFNPLDDVKFKRIIAMAGYTCN